MNSGQYGTVVEFPCVRGKKCDQAEVKSVDVQALPPCAGCGACCHLTVALEAGDTQVPPGLIVEHDGVRCMDQRGNGACVALDPRSRLCTIYELRPAVCRQFERGSERCRSVLLQNSGKTSWLKP